MPAGSTRCWRRFDPRKATDATTPSANTARVLVRRERAHPGAQLTFADHDGHRFQAILTDQPADIAAIERDHRGRARVEDHIRNDKDTGRRNLPFRDFEHNPVWLELVRIAHDLIC
jgi:hypothetical protein